jgi:hypothetical protein
MRLVTPNIMIEHRAIDGDRLAVLFPNRIGGLLEAAGPKLTVVYFLSCG